MFAVYWVLSIPLESFKGRIIIIGLNWVPIKLVIRLLAIRLKIEHIINLNVFSLDKTFFFLCYHDGSNSGKQNQTQITLNVLELNLLNLYVILKLHKRDCNRASDAAGPIRRSQSLTTL